MILFVSKYFLTDGFVLFEENPNVSKLFSEDNQIASIKINKDCTYNMKLFVSFSDLRKNSSNITYVLPLFDKPDVFEVEEEHISVFNIKNIDRLDRYFAIYEPAGRGPAPQELVPKNIVLTENTKTEVYKVDSNNTLSKILEKYKIDQKNITKMQKYINNYIYILTVNTKKLEDLTNNDMSISGYGISFNMHGKLTKTNAGYSFIYPLSTGEIWDTKIKITKVYFSISKDFIYKIDTPKYGENIEYLSEMDYEGNKDRTFTVKEKIDIGNWSYNRIAYLNSNPDKDIIVKLNIKKEMKITNDELPVYDNKEYRYVHREDKVQGDEEKDVYNTSFPRAMCNSSFGYVSRIFDCDPSTQDVFGDKVGAWVIIGFPKMKINKIRILSKNYVNDEHRNERTTEFLRAKDIKIEMSGKSFDFELKDQSEFQDIIFDSRETDFVRLIVKSIYPSENNEKENNKHNLIALNDVIIVKINKEEK